MEESIARHIIIAGSNRSGTTSLFNYLCHHPGINGSKVKQTNYFLDAKMLAEQKLVPIHHSDEQHRFSDLFPPSDANYWLEASPDYLYSEGTAQRIQHYFDRSPYLIFLLREPNDRLKSWFEFGKQQGQVPKEESYAEFLKKCQKEQYADRQAYRALQTGAYHKYLKPYYERFPSANIKVVLFEDLKQNPQQTIFDLLDWLDLSEKPFQNYDFVVYNQSRKVKNRALFNVYRQMMKIVNHSFLINFRRMGIVMWLKALIKKRIFGQEANRSQGHTNPDRIDFSAANRKLEDLLQRKLPW